MCAMRIITWNLMRTINMFVVSNLKLALWCLSFNENDKPVNTMCVLGVCLVELVDYLLC